MRHEALNRFSAWFGFALLAGGALWFVFGLWPAWRGDILSMLSRLDLSGRWPLMASSILAAFASLYFAPSPWIRLLRRLPGGGIGRSEARRNWYLTQMGSYIPGRVWMFLGRLAFLRSRGVGAGVSLVSMAQENISLMTSACLLALIAVAPGGGGLPGEAGPFVAVSLALILAALAAPRVRDILVERMTGRFGRATERLSIPRTGLRDQFYMISTGILSWALRGFSLFLWFDFAGLGGGERPAMLAVCIIAMPVSWLVSLVWVFIPGGIGVRESFQGLALAPFAGGLAVAVTVTLCHRLVLLLVEVLFATEAALHGTLSRKLPHACRIARLAWSAAAAFGSRLGLWMAPLPINITFSITRRCQSRCGTCLIWKAGELPEMDLEAIEKAFRSIGWTYFFNVSGGEPYLRKDLPEIVRLACRHLHPAVIHIPTNALMPERIEQATREMLEIIEAESPGTVLTVKPSFDGIGARHDEIRGVPGNFDKLLDTLGRLEALRSGHPALHVGVGTVVSRFNAGELDGVIEYARGLGVDTYINEIAEEREEFFNLGSGITPDPSTYGSIMDGFRRATIGRMSGMRLLGRITSGLRLVYYDLVVRILEQRRQVIPCYAGILNVHINADGAVWPCAIRAYAAEMGRLGPEGGFMEAWHSEEAGRIRRSIRRGECWCPLANQAYSNMLMHPPSLFKAALAGMRVRRRKPVGCGTGGAE